MEYKGKIGSCPRCKCPGYYGWSCECCRRTIPCPVPPFLMHDLNADIYLVETDKVELLARYNSTMWKALTKAVIDGTTTIDIKSNMEFSNRGVTIERDTHGLITSVLINPPEKITIGF